MGGRNFEDGLLCRLWGLCSPRSFSALRLLADGKWRKEAYLSSAGGAKRRQRDIDANQLGEKERLGRNLSKNGFSIIAYSGPSPFHKSSLCCNFITPPEGGWLWKVVKAKK